MTPSLIVDHPGLLSIIVDKARIGFQDIGITAGGPADNYSCLWANKLVGNDTLLPSIEIVGEGAQFTFSEPCTIAITGGSSEVKLNHQVFHSWQNFQVKSGDRVRILNSDFGIRHYIAVHGGLKVKPIFGSATTVTRDKLGGHQSNGDIIKANDRLYYCRQSFPWSLKAPELALRKPADEHTLDLVIGYQHKQFKPAELYQFYNNEYEMLPNSSRMAARFKGKPIKSPTQPILSEGIAKGAVQIPPDGLPIVMLVDRQTVGGYPKVGSITSRACDQLAQGKVGCEFVFLPIDIQQAHNKLTLEHAKMQRLLSKCYAVKAKIGNLT